MSTAPFRPLTPLARQAEDRRHTRGLTSEELRHFLRAVRITGCRDEDLRAQVTTDAILYYAAPGHEVPARDAGGQNLSYYLLIKAKNLFTDAVRAEKAAKRGGGATVLSLDYRYDNGEGDTGTFDVADPQGAIQPELDADRLRAAVARVLGPVPEKLRVFELHLAGLTPAEITVALGWGQPEGPKGAVDSGRVRKSLSDSKALLVKALPALAALRLGEGPKWAADENVARPARHLTSEECEARALAVEGYALSKRTAKRLQLAA